MSKTKQSTAIARELIRRNAKMPPAPLPLWMLNEAAISGHKQPGNFTAVIYPTYAVMEASDVEYLSTYSDNPYEVPYNQFQGKMWKSERDSKWYLNWLDYPTGGEELEHYSLPIITIEMLNLLNPPQEMPF